MRTAPDRRSVEQLAALLDAGPVERARPGTVAPDDVVAGVALASQLRAAAPEPSPSAAFRAQLRTRLVAVATVQAAADAPAAPPVRTGGRFRRLATVAAGALAGVVAVSGVAVASSRSLPGDPFYGVKTGVESLQLRAASGPVALGERHLQLAATRLREVRELSADGAQAPRLQDGLAAMDTQVSDAGALLVAASSAGRDPAPLRALTAALATQQRALAGLVPALPAGNRRQATASLALLAIWDGRATALLQPPARPGGQAPGSNAPGSTAPAGTAPGDQAPTTQGPAAGPSSGPGSPSHTTPSTPQGTAPTVPMTKVPVTTVPVPTRIPVPVEIPGVPTPAVPLPGLPGG